MQQETDHQGGEGKGGVAGHQSHLNGKGGMIQIGLKGLAQHRCVRGPCQLPLCLVAHSPGLLQGPEPLCP